MDVVLHPRFAENKLVYLTYSKPGENGLIATALARGEWDGTRLVTRGPLRGRAVVGRSRRRRPRGSRSAATGCST